MRVLLMHDYYQYPGGEDQVVAQEGNLLEEHGHTVVRMARHNDAVARLGALRLAARTVWSREAYRAVRALAREVRPHVAHIHNTLPLLSPSVYYALKAEGVPVVQTLHNYRLLCPNALLFRGGHVCEECVGRLPLPALRHKCYRGSLPATGALAAMLVAHRALGTYRRMVDRYIALTEFGRSKLLLAGLPPERVVVKPNFRAPTEGPGLAAGDRGPGEHMLYVGRLAVEKGVGVLLEAWEQGAPDIPLVIVGDGPLAAQVSAAAERCGRIRFLGWQDSSRVAQLMSRARALLLPSLWYEGFPVVLVEAYAAGLPVIASDLGALSSLVRPRQTGLHVEAGRADALAGAAALLWREPDLARELGRGARALYESDFTPEASYRALMRIYRDVGAEGTDPEGTDPAAFEGAAKAPSQGDLG